MNTAGRLRILSFVAGVLAVIVGIGPPDLLAQVEITGAALPGPSSLQVDAIAFAGSDPPLSRLDVYVQVGYDFLSFVKNGNQYDASYEMTISLFDSANSLAGEKLWTEQLNGVSFEQSVSPAAHKLTQRSFHVYPGKYSVQVQLRDNETKITRRVDRTILVSDFAHSRFSLSDMMVVKQLDLHDSVTSILPSVSANVGDVQTPFHVFFETYNNLGLDSVRFVESVLDEKKHTVLETDSVARLHAGRNETFLSIDQSRLPLGDYTLYVRAFPATDTVLHGDAFVGESNRPIIVRWHGMPNSVKNLDLAVEQLKYIAKDNDISYIEDAKSPEEKQRRFLEYWKKRDPNPNTPRNERMEEYYGRVEYANQHFTHYLEGWRTDMGMVYIIFGPPNNVDRHPFELGSKPYEVWSYYVQNYQFVFLDETGLGDYRLITPLWEIWERPHD